MTDAEQAELVQLVAEAVTAAEASQPGNWWALVNSWGPAIAVPTLTLAAILFGLWRGMPRLLAWLDRREQHREAREDALRHAYFDSLREVVDKTACALRDSAPPPPNRPGDDTATSRMRLRIAK